MTKHKIVIIGSSGSGLHFLKLIFEKMPKLEGSVVLIQHMPGYVNLSVRDNLAAQTEMTVKIAEEGEALQSGTLYIAPSEVHLKIEYNERIRLGGSEKVNFVCPSIDVAMMSLGNNIHTDLIGVLLSGIGDDGIQGIAHIKQLGGMTIALAKDDSAITGMAEEAVAMGSVDWVLNPSQIRNKLMATLGWEVKKT